MPEAALPAGPTDTTIAGTVTVAEPDAALRATEAAVTVTDKSLGGGVAGTDYALAAFFAITLIEEVGKIIILGNAKLGSELDRKGFYDRRRKYTYAVYTTLLVNSRVSRIYGCEESRFARWLSEGELFHIRNQALYLDFKNGETIVPQKAVPKEDAFLLVCIAGEVYAEIQGQFAGTGLAEWERILREVDLFHEGKRDCLV